MKKIVVVAGCLLASAQTGAAQTLFAWPDSKVDLSSYHYIENCLTVGVRVEDSARSAEKFIEDTVFNPRGRRGFSQKPQKAQESLRECLSTFSPTQFPREATMLAQRVYLAAGLVEEAESVVHRGLSEIAKTDTASRSSLLDSAVLQFLLYPPAQLRAAVRLIDTLERFGLAYRRYNLLYNYGQLMFAAYSAFEDSVGAHAAQRVRELAPGALKGALANEVNWASGAVRWSIKLEQRERLLDSLRKGTTSYATFLSALVRKAVGFEIPGQIAIGDEAPVLQGDFWFPSEAGGQEFPRRGRASILVFLPDRVPEVGRGFREFPALRRLATKFPTVDLVLVTSTAGFFGPLEPPAPAREAFLADSIFRNFHRLNPIVSVTKGTFVQLDAPDSRRIYQPFPNWERYRAEGQQERDWALFLIDDDRRVVDHLALSAGDEGWMVQVLETLVERMGRGQGR